MDEFSFIASLLAPLAAAEAGALGLKDDAAVLRVPSGMELVVTQDAMTEGVHFIGDESADAIARKLLRVNLSDLAAMGAKPWGYFLTLMLPATKDETWLAAFVRGLAMDQQKYGITLMGGDTTRIHGPLALSVTALGLVPSGKALKRSGAKPGDAIYVSGTIGDAALGLTLAMEKMHAESTLLERYRLPEPRVLLGQRLCGIASACMDISDGLMQDMGHICKASGVGAEISWPLVPLSDTARALLKTRSSPYEAVLTGGDDYELLFTVPVEAEPLVVSAAKVADTMVTRIGYVTKTGEVKALTAEGAAIALQTTGYKHF